MVDGENIKEINQNILKGNYSASVEEYLLKLTSNDKLASQMVANDWNKISMILEKCVVSNQEKIVKSINMNFAEATGYQNDFLDNVFIMKYICQMQEKLFQRNGKQIFVIQ